MGVSRLLNSCAMTAAMVPMVARRCVSVSSALTRSSCCCAKAICRVSCSSAEMVEGDCSLTHEFYRREMEGRLIEQFVRCWSSLLDDGEQLLGDVAGLFFRQFRVDRQGEHLAAGALGFGEVSFPVTQVGETF